METSLEIITNDTELYFNSESIDINKAAKELTTHMKNKGYYPAEGIRVYSGVKIDNDFSTKNLREIVCKKHARFESANLKDAGMAGSLFVETDFWPCDYTNTNFQSSDFRTCTFWGAHLTFTAFNRSCFINTTFEDCFFDSVSMCDCKFIDCQFIRCKWCVRVENTIFENCTLIDVTFKNMNLEFASFENIHTENIKFPFPTIPYIYGGLTYLMNTNDNVRVSSATKASGISKEEYLECLYNLEQYYKGTQNYFPLCNILIAKKQYNYALICVVKGLKNAILIRKFRMLINYCKLLKYIPNVTAHIRQEIYTELMNTLHNTHLAFFEQASLDFYLPQAVSILFNDLSSECLVVRFDTNIINSDTQRLGVLYSSMDKLLGLNCNYSVEIRHNSPISVLLQIVTDPVYLSILVGTISMAFCGIQLSYTIRDSRSKKISESIKENVNESNNKITDDFVDGEKKLEQHQKAMCVRQDLDIQGIVINNCSIYINGDVFIQPKK